MNMTLLYQIFELCIIPLLGILTKYVIDYLNAKKIESNVAVENEIANKYNEMIIDTVIKCVTATNQTYVNALKESGTFNKAAQQEAFNRTMNSILAILSDDAKEYIEEITNDTTVYLTQLIEAEVNNRK